MSAIVALYAFVYQIISGNYTLTDTTSYFEAYDKITRGKIDSLRTPIYPLFIGLIRNIVGNSHCHIIIILIQILIFIISIHYFYKVANLLKNKKLVYWITFIYGVIPVIQSWNTIILTESLSISTSILYIYFTIFAIKTKQIKKVWLSTFWMLFLIMLRPSFICLLPINFFIFCIGKWKDKEIRRIIFNGIMGCLAVILILYGYCNEMQREYGVFTPSGVSLINKYMIKRENGTLNINDIKNKELKDYISSEDFKDAENSYYEAIQIVDKFGFKKLKKILKNNSIMPETKNILKRFISSSNYKYNIVTDIIPFTIIEPFIPNTAMEFLVLLICIIYIIAYIYKNKNIPKTTTFLVLFSSGIITISIIGAPGDFGRLFLPSYPAALLITGMLTQMMIQMIRNKSFLRNEFEE